MADDAPSRQRPTALYFAWVASIYFAEGLPFSIVHQLSAQVFTFLGASLKVVGLTALYGLAWNLKFVWSPLVDRIGTLRGWVLATEFALAALVLATSWPAASGEVRGVAYALIAVAIVAATHDIAIDGFYLAALDKTYQTALSGLRVGAYRAALLVGSGLLVMLGGKAGWRWSFVVAAAILFLLALAHARALPRVARIERAQTPPFLDAFVSFLKQPGILRALPFILFFKAGDALMFAMSAPFVKSLGFAATGSGTLSLFGTISSVLGTVAAAAVITRRGLDKTLVPITIAQSLAILMYVGLALLQPGVAVVGLVVLLEQFAGGVGNAALLVFLMRRTSGDHKAAHFAMASAVMSIALTGAGSASGFLAARLGFPAFFALAFAASLPGIAFAWLAPKERAEPA